MARGADAKLRRRNKRKNENEEVTNMFNVNSDDESDDDGVNNEGEDKETKKKSKDKKSEEEPLRVPVKKKEIKKTPLILLIMMVGTTVLPALIYGADMLANYAQKHHLLGSIGYRMGMGSVPRKRVLSFYEKHDPSKIEDVPTILSKHYGDYPKLVKKLERKYGDYGYFLGWEEDEAPLTLALEQIAETREYFVEQYWNRYAPQVLKTAARNIRYNLTFLYKKGHKVWKRQVWPMLEPIFGAPGNAEAQKRKDAKKARERQEARTGGSGTRRKSKDYRDDVED